MCFHAFEVAAQEQTTVWLVFLNDKKFLRKIVKIIIENIPLMSYVLCLKLECTSWEEEKLCNTKSFYPAEM